MLLLTLINNHIILETQTFIVSTNLKATKADPQGGGEFGNHSLRLLGE